MVHRSPRLVSRGIWTLANIFLIFPQELSGKYYSSSFFQVSLINPSSSVRTFVNHFSNVKIPNQGGGAEAESGKEKKKKGAAAPAAVGSHPIIFLFNNGHKNKLIMVPCHQFNCWLLLENQTGNLRFYNEGKSNKKFNVIAVISATKRDWPDGWRSNGERVQYLSQCAGLVFI